MTWSWVFQCLESCKKSLASQLIQGVDSQSGVQDLRGTWKINSKALES
jgi:hypothetical protein